MQRQLGHLLAVAGQHSFERLPLLEFRLLRDHCRNTLKAIEHLCVHGVLDPQRAVLIESRDAFFGRHKLCARSVGRRANEVNDGLLSGSVVPRRELTVGSCARADVTRSSAGMESKAGADSRERRLTPKGPAIAFIFASVDYPERDFINHRLHALSMRRYRFQILSCVHSILVDNVAVTFRHFSLRPLDDGAGFLAGHDRESRVHRRAV